MAVTIPATFPDLPGYPMVGRPIRDGNAAGSSGLLRMGQAGNYLAANCCKSHVCESWIPVFGVTAGTLDLPPGRVNGARWNMQVTPLWTQVEVTIRAYVSANAGTITVYSRTANVVFNVAAVAATWYAPMALAVSDVGVEQYWVRLNHATDTIYLAGMTIEEVPKGTLP